MTQNFVEYMALGVLEKQLYYYKVLCKKYNIEKIEDKFASKLDLKKAIGEIINEKKSN